jgi:hypothetical protein
MAHLPVLEQDAAVLLLAFGVLRQEAGRCVE